MHMISSDSCYMYVLQILVDAQRLNFSAKFIERARGDTI